jgi:hypothetical protein
MKRQAAYNGEVGANGRAYVKGQFIAEQAEYLGAATKTKKGSGKQEIEPYVWEVPESPEMKSIYRFIQGVFGDLASGQINEKAIAFHGEDPKKIQSLIARYQQGDRWYFPNQETYI